MSKTVDARKEGTKPREEVASRQGNARDAAIHAVRKAADQHWPATQQATETIQQMESLGLRTELHRMFYQAVHNHTLARINLPTLDAFLQTLHSQTPISQVAHQNATN